MSKVWLDFATSKGAIELSQMAYYAESLDSKVKIHKCSTDSEDSSLETFRWTGGVIALCGIFLKAKYTYLERGQDSYESFDTSLINYRNPEVAFLETLLSQSPNWLTHLFNPSNFAKQDSGELFVRPKTEVSSSPASEIGFNSSWIHPKNIFVTLDTNNIDLKEEIAALFTAIGLPLTLINDSYPNPIQLSPSIKEKASYSKKIVLSDSDYCNITASALMDVEKAFGSLRQSCPSLCVPISIELEHKIPQLLLRRLGHLVGKLINTASNVIPHADFVTVFLPNEYFTLNFSHDRNDHTDLVITIQSSSHPSSLLLKEPLENCMNYSEIKIIGPSFIAPYASALVKTAAAYFTHAYAYTQEIINNCVQRFNPPSVDHLYQTLRRYLSSLGVSDGGLLKFSIFGHINGRSRYFLDSLRFNEVRSLIHSSSLFEKFDKFVLTNDKTQFEAWYATSVTRSSDTMSFTESAIPHKAWCGTPNTWKRPVVGFGTSELTVYGTGMTSAEPISLGYEVDQFSLCAIFDHKPFEALHGKFLALPEKFALLLENTCEELRHISLGKGTLLTHEEL